MVFFGLQSEYKLAVWLCTFVTGRQMPYSQICGTKLGTSYKKRRLHELTVTRYKDNICQRIVWVLASDGRVFLPVFNSYNF